jgi:hypothetical protein
MNSYDTEKKHDKYIVTVSLYPLGAGVSAGLQLPEMVMLEKQTIRYMINSTVHPLTGVRESCVADSYRIIQNYVLSGQFPGNIDCLALSKAYQDTCVYKPSGFVAVIFRTPDGILSKYSGTPLRSVTALIFGSGELIISGVVNTQEILEIIHYIIGVLKRFPGVEDSSLNPKSRQAIRTILYQLSQSENTFDPYVLLSKLKKSDFKK